MGGEYHEVLVQEDSNHHHQFRKGSRGEENRVVGAGVEHGVHPQNLAVQNLDMGVSGGGRRGPQFEVWKRRCQRRILGFGSAVLPWAFRRTEELGYGLRLGGYVRTPLSIGRRRTKRIRWIVDLLAFGGGRLRQPGRS